MPRSLPRPRRRRALVALALAGGLPAAVLAPSPAGAATPTATVMTIDQNDRIGDTEYGAGSSVDLVSAIVTQDRVAGVISAKLTFHGDPTLSPMAWIDVGLAFRFGSNRYCFIDKGIGGIAHLRSQIGSPDATWIVHAPTDITGPATKVIEGNTITITSAPSSLLTSVYSCMNVEVLDSDDSGALLEGRFFDSIVAAAPKEEVAPTPVVPPASVDGKPQTVPDRDGDAVPDATDACVDVPGAGTDGCPTTPAAKALKLGTKRLVVDRLLQRTGTTCPASVKATVVAKGRTLGKQKLGVIAKGSWCHVAGVVKLKKKAKKVRVVLSGTGVAPVKQVVAKG